MDWGRERDEKSFSLSEIALSKIEIDSAKLSYYYFLADDLTWLSSNKLQPQLRVKKNWQDKSENNVPSEGKIKLIVSDIEIGKESTDTI